MKISRQNAWRIGLGLSSFVLILALSSLFFEKFEPDLLILAVTTIAVILYTVLTFIGLEDARERERTRREDESAKAKTQFDAILDSILGQLLDIGARAPLETNRVSVRLRELRAMEVDLDILFDLSVAIGHPTPEYVHRALYSLRYAVWEQERNEKARRYSGHLLTAAGGTQDHLRTAHDLLHRVKNPEMEDHPNPIPAPADT